MDTNVFSNLTEKLAEEMSNIGLYLGAPVAVHGQPMNEEIGEAVANGEMTEKDALKNGLAEFKLMAEFNIGKVAWTKQVLDPEGYEAEKQFAAIEAEVDDEDLRAAEIRAMFEDDADTD